MKRHIELLEARVDKCTSTTSLHASQIDDLRSYSMKRNLIFDFDKCYNGAKEAAGENCVAIIKAFLSSVMGITDSDKMMVPVAHRLGAPRSGFIRPIIAKFPIADEMDRVMRNTNRLRNTRHFIKRQLTPNQREREQFMLPMYKSIRSSGGRARISKGKLVVNGQVQTQFMPPCLPNVDDVHIPDPPITTDSITDSGSHFDGYAAHVKSLSEVSAVLTSLKLQPAAARADHLIYAYILTNSDGLISHCNYDSDGDWGVGLELLRFMKDTKLHNVVCLATRTMDSQNWKHIGKRRFEHVNTVCSQAHDKLKNT